jgi:hypothetical protein
MKKKFIFTLCTLLAVSFATAGFADFKKFKQWANPSDKKKNQDKTVTPETQIAAVNTLIGTWAAANGTDAIEITFTADTAVFRLYKEDAVVSSIDAKYTFTASPLTFTNVTKDSSVKIPNLSMSYTMVNKRLTYRFLNTTSGAFKDTGTWLYQKKNTRTGKFADADFIATTAAPRHAKPADKPAAAGTVVLAKGIKISWCGNIVTDNGSITIPSLTEVPTVKKGKFDLVLPANPVFGTDEWELSQQMDGVEFDFAGAKVYPIRVMFLQNDVRGDDHPKGRCYLSFKLYYSDKDVKGTINGEPVTLKKGWNVIGDTKDAEVTLMCVG